MIIGRTKFKLRKKVLILDNDAGRCRLLKIFLEQNLFLADFSGNGRAGFMKALNIHYDLIIVSATLPGMDGFHFLKNLRETKSTPVIILSTQDDKNVCNFYLKSGANDYVVIPYSCISVVERVKRLIS
jgi:DNA-binding response OmpR family regulator